MVALATSDIAVICGTPTPATILVVQIDPGPIPTLTASTPALINAFAASFVAILPAINWSFGYFFLINLIESIIIFECPWAVSITSTSTSASIKFLTLSSISFPTPIAAPTLSLCSLSLQAFGKSFDFCISFTVIIPFKWNLELTTRTFSILFLCKSDCTVSLEAPSWTVTNLSFGVIIVETFGLTLFTNLKSLDVTIPTRFLPSTTGTPDILCLAVNSRTSFMEQSGEVTTGSEITPLSYFLTFTTSLAWSSTDKFLWMIPIPPSWAIAMASSDSVTVSMAADNNGIFNWIFDVSCVFKQASDGRILEWLGTSRTSSNVKASWITFSILTSLYKTVL